MKETVLLSDIRKKILKLCYKGESGHIASSFSIVEILYVLYRDYNSPKYSIYLSKGHAAPALYVIMHHFGLLSLKILKSYCKKYSPLFSHPDSQIEGIEISSGALGIVPSFVVGQELANILDHVEHHSFIIVGDGELNEGSIWETLMFIGQNRINHITILVDNNNLQASNVNSKIIKSENLFRAIESLGFKLLYVDGHNTYEIASSLSASLLSTIPVIIILQTKKGKGVSFMENSHEWHHKIPDKKFYLKALKELNYYEK